MAAALTLLLFCLSVVEHCVTRISRVALRALAETVTDPKVGLLEEIARDRIHFLVPLQFGIQVLQVSLTVLMAALFAAARVDSPFLLALLSAVSVVLLFRQLIPRLITQGDPEKVLLTVLPLFTGFYRVLRWLSSPLLAILRVAHASRMRNHLPNAHDEETTEEEIQAYLGVGREEGILEGEESALIESALEFRTTLAREIMTPRAEIVAIEETAVISQLRSVMVLSKHSRIPVYRENLDQIVGVVYVRNLLAHLEEGTGNDPITPLINNAWFVPETKRVLELLKEMQTHAEHVAIVINEYGAVSGLVTIEDIVEEIVGEIRDEDELQEVDLRYEADGTYLVRGGVEIEELEAALDVDLGDIDVATVSGLVVGHLGRVPPAGEKVNLHGLEVEVLSSDRKRIHTMRVRKGAKVPLEGAEVEAPGGA